jgi:hypothetical protein
MKTKVRVLVPLIDNGMLYLPGETIEQIEELVERGIAHQLYELIDDAPKKALEDGELNG